MRELRSNLASLLNDVSDRRDHVLVTRNGKSAAAPIDEYEALEETAEILSDPDALSARWRRVSVATCSGPGFDA